jgi:hypothetical protein
LYILTFKFLDSRRQDGRPLRYLYAVLLSYILTTWH